MIKKYIERIATKAIRRELEGVNEREAQDYSLLNRRIADALAVVEQLNGKLTELADRLMDAERNISDHEARLDDIERIDIPELNSDIDDLRDRIEELERAVSKFDNVRKSVYDIAENIRAAMSEIMEEVEG